MLIDDVVDGGHRAIKYTRVGGVKSDIFNEGTLHAKYQTRDGVYTDHF